MYNKKQAVSDNVCGKLPTLKLLIMKKKSSTSKFCIGEVSFY
jgi:hypothetical protein